MDLSSFLIVDKIGESGRWMAFRAPTTIEREGLRPVTMVVSSKLSDYSALNRK